METVIGRFFFDNWQKKIFALITGIVIWFFVNHSIIATKMIPSVPVRIAHIPPDKTVLGLLPNGVLNKRLTLTLTGTKDVIEKIEPGDLEILIDASTIDHNDWVLRLTKANLNSLDPTNDLNHHVTNIVHTEYVIKMRDLIEARIPVTINPPTGDPPEGYELLNIWPEQLMQTVNGAEEEIQKMKMTGLELNIDLNKVRKEELDKISTGNLPSQGDEVSFFLPNSWKKIQIPCRPNAWEEINDPEAEELQIDFLKKKVLPVETALPIRVFYPLKNSQEINPKSYPLLQNNEVQDLRQISVFTPKLFVRDVTQVFLNTIRDNTELVITAAPKTEREFLEWSIQIIDPNELEDTYINFLFAHHPHAKDARPETLRRREKMYRNRFREYMKKLRLYTTTQQPLDIEATLNEDGISVEVQ